MYSNSSLYRVKRWIALTGNFNHFRYRRLLTLMSPGWVSFAWLKSHSGLSTAELQDFLDILRKSGVLEIRKVEMPLPASARFAGNGSVPRRAKGAVAAGLSRLSFLGRTWRQLRRWLARPIRLEGSGLGLRIEVGHPKVLKPYINHTVPDASSGLGVQHLGAFARSPVDDLSSMYHSLVAVLLKHSSIRASLVHLSVVENSWRREGVIAIDKLPRPILMLAVVQLRWLIRRTPSQNQSGLIQLADLLLASTKAVRQASSPERVARVDSGFDADLVPDVTEANMTDFLAEEQLWLPTQLSGVQSRRPDAVQRSASTGF